MSTPHECWLCTARHPGEGRHWTYWLELNWCGWCFDWGHWRGGYVPTKYRIAKRGDAA